MSLREKWDEQADAWAAFARTPGHDFSHEHVDLVIAYMSLMNFDDMEAGVREAARVLDRGGRFCFAVLHPLFAAGELLDPADPESPFLIRAYFEAPAKVWTSERDGITMTFHDRCIPLETYSHALERARLSIETLRDPSRRIPRQPLYLQMRALKP